MSELAEQFRAGQARALSRLISMVERHDVAADAILAELRGSSGPQPRRVGLTGAPGAGKSTLTGALIASLRARGRSVGVLAVDPSSPFSGGALLGDRLRMDDHLMDPGVFVRSMGARGRLGGLAPDAGDVAWLLGAFGFDEVLVETVGTGQSELDLPTLVDTTVVLLTPAAGDSIQLEKAGIIEVADIFVVNKADLPGADRMVRDLRTMLRLGPRSAWVPPVIATVATGPDGADGADGADDVTGELWTAVEAHRAHLADHPEGRVVERRQLRESAAEIVAGRVRAWALAECDRDAELAGLVDRRLPHVVADQLFARFGRASADRGLPGTARTETGR